ncbi:hypothetical protein CR165_10785 [Pseudoroseomonas aestuarii]|uniref:Uncharacterized protein n=1 Tax=Teichococcus aestuarii TaxID=568898 RepID=A0A2U1V5A5_9PROT|nr:hypothetical protein CR165_10785 [Pseudoroseomonas aestuarii]
MLAASERDLLRRELCVRFGTRPKLADGIFLRVWRSGPLAGQPKVPVAMQDMVDRGLMVVRAGSPYMARAYFTDAGLDALRWLAAQRRGLDPVQFAHVRQELGMGELDSVGPE